MIALFFISVSEKNRWSVDLNYLNSFLRHKADGVIDYHLCTIPFVLLIVKECILFHI